LIESVTRDLKSIEAAWRRHDKADLLERIHSLKGALFIVGEHATANDCGLTELCIRTRDMADCDRAVERLKASLRRLLEAYSGHM
jgi:HPt (histidine-containing phosphotransfer) domain-containing protein